jgi:N-dimethylarginine dimethylaminohydrolase
MRYLMCKPQYYNVNYVINPWMVGNLQRVFTSEANAQWTSLYGLMRSYAQVDLIDPAPDLPDMPFTANGGLVIGNKAVVSNFLRAERKSEERLFERWFTEKGFAIHRLPGSIPFEGAGDALLDRATGCIWMGYGQRSSRDAVAQVRDIFGVEAIALHLIDPNFYHLDTCFCPLNGGYVMYHPGAFSDDARSVLAAKIPPEKRILVESDDAHNFACNALNIGDVVILNRASDRLKEGLSRAGFRTLQCPVSEFLKAGGGSKCLVLRLEEAVSSA